VLRSIRIPMDFLPLRPIRAGKSALRQIIGQALDRHVDVDGMPASEEALVLTGQALGASPLDPLLV
jgi:hypothetical protein